MRFNAVWISTKLLISNRAFILIILYTEHESVLKTRIKSCRSLVSSYKLIFLKRRSYRL
jgi:hypothetical protein